MDAAVLSNPHLDLYRHWEAARRGRSMPAADDFNAALLSPSLRRYLAVVEAGENGFRCRHAGTQLSADHGRALAGVWLASHHRHIQEHDGMPAPFRAVSRTRMPIFGIGRGHMIAGLAHSVGCLLLPLGGEAGIDTILLCRLGAAVPESGQQPVHQTFDFDLARAFGVTSLQHLEDLSHLWRAGPADMPTASSAA